MGPHQTENRPPASGGRPVRLVQPDSLALEDQAFTLRALALQLTHPAHGFGFLARTLLRGLLEVIATLHFAESTFPLHLLLQRLQRLIDVVLAHHDLYQGRSPIAGLQACISCPPDRFRERRGRYPNSPAESTRPLSTNCAGPGAGSGRGQDSAVARPGIIDRAAAPF